MTELKILLLDRDGTVIVDPPNERVTSEQEIELFPDTISALKKLADNDFAVVLITNQAGISEGLMTEEDFWRVHAEIVKGLEQSGIKILKTFACLHGPEAGCVCRKPKPAMLKWAAEEFDLNLADTYMVGDRRSDVLTGKNAGTKTILVRTATNKQDEAPEADFQADNLTEAVEYVIANG